MNLFHKIGDALEGLGRKGVVINGSGPVQPNGVIGYGALDNGIRFIVNEGGGLSEWQGNAWETSAVFPALRFLGDGLANSPVRFIRTVEGKDGPKQELVKDPRAGLLANPCPEYDGVAFAKGMAISWALEGNAYALIERDDLYQPSGLIWCAPWGMRPVGYKGNGDGPAGRLSHYERYLGQGQWKRERIEDVIHVRDGIDPSNPLLGLSAWRAMIAEVLTDHDAARASHYLMRRLGVVPYALALKTGANDAPLTQEDLDLTKAKLMDATGAERSGEPPIIARDAQVLKLGSSPEELVLDKVRSIPTQRVAACFRLDPMTIHLPSDDKKFANYKEAREAAMEEAILPMQASFQSEYTRKLCTPLDRLRNQEWRFDNSNVRELQEDVDALHNRIRSDYQAGLCSKEEGQQRLGYSDKGTFYSAAPATVAVPKSVQMLVMQQTAEGMRSV